MQFFCMERFLACTKFHCLVQSASKGAGIARRLELRTALYSFHCKACTDLGGSSEDQVLSRCSYKWNLKKTLMFSERHSQWEAGSVWHGARRGVTGSWLGSAPFRAPDTSVAAGGSHGGAATVTLPHLCHCQLHRHFCQTLRATGEKGRAEWVTEMSVVCVWMFVFVSECVCVCVCVCVRECVCVC